MSTIEQDVTALEIITFLRNPGLTLGDDEPELLFAIWIKKRNPVVWMDLYSMAMRYGYIQGVAK